MAAQVVHSVAAQTLVSQPVLTTQTALVVCSINILDDMVWMTWCLMPG